MLGLLAQIVKVYVEVFVEVYTHVIWIFFCLLERSRCSTGGDSLVDDEGFTIVGSSSGSVTGSWIIIGCTCSP